MTAENYRGMIKVENYYLTISIEIIDSSNGELHTGSIDCFHLNSEVHLSITKSVSTRHVLLNVIYCEVQSTTCKIFMPKKKKREKK